MIPLMKTARRATMTPPSESLGQDLKAWARDKLQLGPTASPEQVRAAYLRQVQDSNGGPNLSAREALLILTERTGGAPPVMALDAVEEQIQQVIDSFASRFFAMPIRDRKGEWDRLWARGQGLPRVAARLDALRPGLSIDVSQLDRASPLGQLAQAACESFLLRPTARAIYRQGCCEKIFEQRQLHHWKGAGISLRADHPSLAALAPELVSSFVDGRPIKRATKWINLKMRWVALAGDYDLRTFNAAAALGLIMGLLFVVGSAIRIWLAITGRAQP
jgi:hypothetical protein